MRHELSAAMKPLGEINGCPVYWAEPGRFTAPGVYYWDGKTNVQVPIPCRPEPSAPGVAEDEIALAVFKCAFHPEDVATDELIEGHKRTFGPTWEHARECAKAVAALSRPAPTVGVEAAADHIRGALDFAYKQGLHEFGYDPLATILAALSRSTPEGWRDISTAPKDGTRFRSQDRKNYGDRVFEGTYWYVHPSVTGWNTDDLDCGDYEFEPTHWLPAAPIQQGAGEEGAEHG